MKVILALLTAFVLYTHFVGPYLKDQSGGRWHHGLERKDGSYIDLGECDLKFRFDRYTLSFEGFADCNP